MAFWDNPAVAGSLGLLTGGATAYIQSALSSRAKAGEELRERRLDAYPVVWLQTAKLSFYPRAQLAWSDLKELHLAFRNWYFTTGGLLLSERSRARYGDVQELISTHLSLIKDLTGPVPPDVYNDLAQTASAFRTALAEDLATRRQRSLIWALASRRWHRRRSHEAKQRIKAAGGDASVVYPLEELS